jgi:YVTN family beta-propeller protein
MHTGLWSARRPRARRAFIVASLLLSACSGAHHTPPMASGGTTLQTPQSISPGSITPPPMARTAILPSSAMRSPSGSAVKPMTAIQGMNYSQVPGTASAASAAADGSLWVLSDSPSGADKYIWHYANGSWTNITGMANHISAAPDGSLYASNSQGGVYHYAGGNWTALGGGVSDITAAADGTLYVLSNGQPTGSDQAIWHYDGSWTQIPGTGLHIAASLDGVTHLIPAGTIGPNGLYVVGAGGAIYYTKGDGSYTQFPGSASAIAPSAAGGVFVLGYSAGQPAGAIYHYDWDNTDWQQVGGQGVAITVAPSHLYVISTSGAIYSAPLFTPQYGYVTNFGDGTISIFDPKTNTVVGTISGYVSPMMIAANINTPYVYFSDFSTARVYAIDSRTNSVTPVEGGCAPWDIAMRPSGTTAYIGAQCSNTLDILNTATNADQRITLPQYPYFTTSSTVFANPVLRVIYVASNAQGDNSVYVYDEAQQAFIARIFISYLNAWSYAANSTGTRLFVGTIAGYVDEVDTTTNQVITYVQVDKNSYITGLAFSPATGLLYAADANGNRIAIIDTSSMTVVGSIAVGTNPSSVTLNAAGTTGYATNDTDGTVSVFDVNSRKTIATIKVGVRPRTVVIRDNGS